MKVLIIVATDEGLNNSCKNIIQIKTHIIIGPKLPTEIYFVLLDSWSDPVCVTGYLWVRVHALPTLLCLVRDRRMLVLLNKVNICFADILFGFTFYCISFTLDSKFIFSSSVLKDKITLLI